MNEGTTGSDRPEMEDYGSPDSNEPSSGGAQTERGGGSQYSGGTAGVEQGSGKGEQFGEFANTGTGTDLTVEMENTDVRSGLVKGGQTGAADAAGPGQYGGATGEMNEEV